MASDFKLLPFLVAAAVIGVGIHSDAAATAKKKAATTTKKPSTPAAKKATTPAQKSSVTKKKGTTSSKKKTVSRRRSAKKAPPRPRGQQQPTSDRYSEIQQALLQRGYFKGEPTGVWGPESADALKRFQQDQKIEATGKLNSLSLIALGLGPKRTATALARPNDDNRSTEGNKGP